MLPQKNRAAVLNGPKNFEIKDLPIAEDSKVLLKILYLTRVIKK